MPIYKRFSRRVIEYNFLIFHLIFCLGVAFGQSTRNQGLESQACQTADGLIAKAIDVGTAGNIQQSWEYLREATAICPTNAAALGNLGYLHAIHGDSENAKYYLERSITFGPSTMEPWINLGNIFKEQIDRMDDSEGREYKDLLNTVWKMYKTAYRLQPSVDVTANLAGLYAMERDWERAALVAEKSLSLQYTEEAFCVLMKALDNICHWSHPMRDMSRLIAILERNVRLHAPLTLISPSTRFTRPYPPYKPPPPPPPPPPGRRARRRRRTPSCATTPERRRSSQICRRRSSATSPAPRCPSSSATPRASPRRRRPPRGRAPAAG
jgi:hypothetical protein